MRLSPAPLRLSRSPALLALALPLAAALAFSDETLDKVPKSEGYCSRILRAQGTRREGYTEFSLRVEGDPDFYKPGTSYRGKWPGVALGARNPAPGTAQNARCGRRAHGPRAHGAGRARQGPSILAALRPSRCQLRAAPEPASGAVAGAAVRPGSPISDARFPGVGCSRATRHAGLAGREPGFSPPSSRPAPGEQWKPVFLQIRLWSEGNPGFSLSSTRPGGGQAFPSPIPEGEDTSFSQTTPGMVTPASSDRCLQEKGLRLPP